jgi:hypothetical protein
MILKNYLVYIYIKNIYIYNKITRDHGLQRRVQEIF